ncbi:hypothetical protein ASC54_08585 [Yonghaparkia sp. Root332]|nr:hypothetical protein ASC54_08585 [Yonghaparkia sp. Root332]
MAAMLLLGLSGCALEGPSGVSDTEARDRFIAVIDEAQRTIGGDWQVDDDPTSRECTIPLWVGGHRYPALRIGEAPSSVERTADAVEQAWRDDGMSVERQLVGDVVEVSATSEFGELFILRVSEGAATLQGESECRPAA